MRQLGRAAQQLRVLLRVSGGVAGGQPVLVRGARGVVAVAGRFERERGRMDEGSLSKLDRHLRDDEPAGDGENG